MKHQNNPAFNYAKEKGTIGLDYDVIYDAFKAGMEYIIQEKKKIVDSIVPKCTAQAKCEGIHNKPGDFVFELRQIISDHWQEDEYSVYTHDEEGMARKIIGLVFDNIINF